MGDNGTDPGVRAPTPVLRMFDVSVTKRFYLDYLGCLLDWEHGEVDGPRYMQVSRGELVLHLSSHHGDGTPGAVILVPTDDIGALHAELHSRNYPFMNPGLEPVRNALEMVLIDPASNQLRFFQQDAAP